MILCLCDKRSNSFLHRSLQLLTEKQRDNDNFATNAGKNAEKSYFVLCQNTTNDIVTAVKKNITSNAGSCVDQVNNYTCICNTGFTGRHCDIVITRCSNDSCYPGVSCNENGNSAISCGCCPSGFTGDGKNCKGNIIFQTKQFHKEILLHQDHKLLAAKFYCRGAF